MNVEQHRIAESRIRRECFCRGVKEWLICAYLYVSSPVRGGLRSIFDPVRGAESSVVHVHIHRYSNRGARAK